MHFVRSATMSSLRHASAHAAHVWKQLSASSMARIGEQAEQSGQARSLLRVDEALLGGANPLGVYGVGVLGHGGRSLSAVRGWGRTASAAPSHPAQSSARTRTAHGHRLSPSGGRLKMYVKLGLALVLSYAGMFVLSMSLIRRFDLSTSTSATPGWPWPWSRRWS